jgi:hypothetical protein
MAKRINEGLAVSLWGLGAGLLVVGCSGSDVSVGQESAAFNLERCYGGATKCAASAETIGIETGIRDCPEEQLGTLEEEQAFSPPPTGFQMDDFKVGPDGSIWALAGQGSQSDIVVARWSPDGMFVGVSEPLASQAEHTTLSCALTLNGAGHALVSVYSVYAATADDALTERLMIHTLGSDLQKVREPLAFRGSGDSLVQGGAGDSFTLGGDARNNAAHGVLARVTAGEPDWVQTAVPSSGLGAGVGVSALSVSADGEASVLAQRSPRWEPGAPDTYTYGVARFDESGNPLWNLILPTAYAGGWQAYMASMPNGDVVVRGVLASNDASDQSLVRLVAHDGRLGWGFRFRGGIDNAVEVDLTGRTVLAARSSVAVIDANGQSCKQYGLPAPATGGTNFPSGLLILGSSVYSASFDQGVRRYRLPAE